MRQLIRLCVFLLLLTPSHPLVATGDILEYENTISDTISEAETELEQDVMISDDVQAIDTTATSTPAKAPETDNEELPSNVQLDNTRDEDDTHSSTDLQTPQQETPEYFVVVGSDQPLPGEETVQNTDNDLSIFSTGSQGSGDDTAILVDTGVSISTSLSGGVLTGQVINTGSVLTGALVQTGSSATGLIVGSPTPTDQATPETPVPTLEERLEHAREDHEGLCKKSTIECIKTVTDTGGVEVTLIENDQSGEYYDEESQTLYEYDIPIGDTDQAGEVDPTIELPPALGTGSVSSGDTTGIGTGVVGTGITITTGSTVSVATGVIGTGVTLGTGSSLIEVSTGATLSGSTATGSQILSRFVDESFNTLMTIDEGRFDMESIKVDFMIESSKASQTQKQMMYVIDMNSNQKKSLVQRSIQVVKSSVDAVVGVLSKTPPVTQSPLGSIQSASVILQEGTYIISDDTRVDTSDLTLQSFDDSPADQTIGGVSFGATSHLVFSDPVRIQLNTTLTDGQVVEIQVRHTGESTFGTHGIGVDPVALCRNDGSITTPGNKTLSTNGMIEFYTCGASDFVVIQSSPGKTTPASNSGPVITSFGGLSVASTSTFEGVLAITGLTATDTNPVGEFGTIDLTSNSWSTISHQYEYCDPIFVATPHYQTQVANTSTDAQRQRAPRIRNKSGAGFDLKVDNHDQNLIPSLVTPTHYIVMERGTHSIDDGAGGSIKMEAGSVSGNSIVSSSAAGYPDGVDVNFQSGFPTPPAVLHTVSTFNDATNVFSYINGGNTADEPTATFMNMTLHTGKDTTFATHAPEDTDWIAFEQGHVNNGGFEADFQITQDQVDCCAIGGETELFESAFGVTPQTILTSQMGEDGGDGGFGVVIPNSATPTQVGLSSDEDGDNADRSHTTEVFGLVSFSSSSGVFFDTDDGDTVTWSIVGGADSSFFTLSSDGDLGFATARDFDTPEDANSDNIYEVQVQATDGTDCSDVALQTIRVEVQDAPPSSCGNGTIESPIEQCDDGNTTNGDGCTSACVIENDWTCTGAPSSCTFCATSEVINATILSGLTNTQTLIEFETFTTHTYSTTPLVFLTPTTDRNTNNPSIPRVHSITTTGVTLSSCVDAGAATCDTSLLDDNFSLFVVDVDAVSCTDHIDAGTTLIDTDGTDTGFTFGTPFEPGVVPFVFTTPQTSNQGNNIAAHAWVDDNTLTNAGGDFVGCAHQAPGDGTSIDNCTSAQPDETLGWVALDPTRFSIDTLQYGEESINGSAWTPISFAPTYTTPAAVMVTQNSDNGGQDPQYPWARNITTAGGEIRYCESDAGGVCNTHTNEDVMWMSFAIQACGDGEVTSLESCDDGNLTDGDGCDSTCEVEPSYTCTGSPSVCTLGICGDGVIEGDEICDDGNLTDGDGCDSSCVEEQGFSCTGQPSMCEVTACGNGIINDGFIFLLQDFETVGTATTTTTNTVISGSNHTITFTNSTPQGRLRYGTDAVQVSEGVGALTVDVDTDNNQNTNFIIIETDLSSLSGSSDLELGFDLSHHGDEPNPDDKVWIRGSNTDAWLEIYDWRTEITTSGIYTLVRNLDIDALLTSNSQTPSTTFQIRFGQDDNFSAVSEATNDGLSLDNITIRDADPAKVETCDDGNSTNGDGCSSTCTVEADYTCTGEPSVCVDNNICGNGQINGTESCDDGNTTDGDGCTSTCTIESGYFCPNSDLCGNGTIEGGEQCDDGNTTDGDGCSQYCIEEFNFNLVTFSGESLVPDIDPGGGLDFPVWNFSSGGYEVTVSTDTNPYATVLYSPFNFWSLAAPRAIELAFQGASDDDFIGYVFGYQPGDWSNPSADFLLVRRKDTDQNFNFTDDPIGGGIAQAGLSIVRVQGVVSYDELRQSIDSPNTTGSVTELIRGTTYGNVGYRPDLYDTSVFYNTGSIEVFVDGIRDISLTGNFQDGRFGIFIMAQQGNTFALGRPHPYGIGGACYGECGDGIIVGDETCDDGNTTNGDGCSEFCSVEQPNECIGQGGGNNCSANATCYDSYEGFDCICNSGFNGDGTTCAPDGGGNNSPTDIVLSGSTIIENNAVGQLVSTLSTTDDDLGDTHTYSFACAAPLPDESFFTLSGSQLLAGTGFNFEIPADINTDNDYEICIVTDDGNGGTYEETVTISVLDEYEEICIYVGTGITFDAIPVSTSGGIVATQVFTGLFQLEDTNGSNTGYYTTLSIGGFSGALGNFMPASIAQIRDPGPITTVSGAVNTNIQIDNALTSFVPFASPVTYLFRNTGPNEGKTGYYQTAPSLRLTIPDYQAVDTYTATITYTLYEN